MSWAAALKLLELVDYAALAAPAAAPAPATPAPSPQAASRSAAPALKLVDLVAAPQTKPAAPPPAPTVETAIAPVAFEITIAPVAPWAAAPVRGTLTFYQAGPLLIVDDSEPPHAEAAAQLLAKILAAARRPPLSGERQSIQWPLPGQLEDTRLGDARDYTEAFLSSRQQRLPFADLWLMGPLPLACVGPAELEFAKAVGQTLPPLGRAAVRVLPNLQSMLSDSGAKARCWHALKRFYELS